MKRNILLSIVLTFVSSVVWSGVVNRTALGIQYPGSEKESKPKEFLVHVSNKDNLYLLSIPGLDGENVEITILDEDSNVLYSRTRLIVTDFCQAFRVEGQTGDIVFEVWNKDDKQIRTFRFPPNGGSARKDGKAYKG